MTMVKVVATIYLTKRYMNKEFIKSRLLEIQNYLDRKWNGLSDHFVERLLARAEYDKLIKQYNEQN